MNCSVLKILMVFGDAKDMLTTLHKDLKEL